MSINKPTREMMIAIEKQLHVLMASDDVTTLRRYASRLSRWDELQCGASDGHVEYNEQLGYWERYSAGEVVNGEYVKTKKRTPNVGEGAYRAITEVCKRYDIHWYHQSDPRGCAVYISDEPISDDTYSTALAVQ